MDTDLLHHRASILSAWSGRLEIHLREIANNERYQRHRAILKARLREVKDLRLLLGDIEHDLQAALDEREGK